MANEKQVSGNEWLTVAEASEFLKLKKPTIYQKIQERKIPFYKPENSSVVRFKKSELNDWLQAGRREVLC